MAKKKQNKKNFNVRLIMHFVVIAILAHIKFMLGFSLFIFLKPVYVIHQE